MDTVFMPHHAGVGIDYFTRLGPAPIIIQGEPRFCAGTFMMRRAVLTHDFLRAYWDYGHTSGCCFNASYDQIAMHKVENQAEMIEKTIDIITDFSGRKPRGWFGPGLTQTYDTLDHLANAGIQYFGDWVLDDHPIPV